MCFLKGKKKMQNKNHIFELVDDLFHLNHEKQTFNILTILVITVNRISYRSRYLGKLHQATL